VSYHKTRRAHKRWLNWHLRIRQTEAFVRGAIASGIVASGYAQIQVIRASSSLGKGRKLLAIAEISIRTAEGVSQALNRLSRAATSAQAHITELGEYLDTGEKRWD
jgi:hypothetical protein